MTDYGQNALARWLVARRPERPRPIQKTPRAPQPKRRAVGFIYFVDCGEFTKIGFTKMSVRERLSTYQTHNPFPLSVWAVIRGSIDDEKEFHEYCGDFHHIREWFQFDAGARVELANTIVRLGGELNK